MSFSISVIIKIAFIDEDKPVTTTTTTTPAPAIKENGEESTEEPPPTYNYDYESLYSKPTVVDMEDNKLQLLYPLKLIHV